MERIYTVLFAGVAAFVIKPGCAANIEYVGGNITSSGNYTVYSDVIVANDASLTARDIRLADSVKITNYGEISGGVNVCAGCTAEIHNVGTFDAMVSLQNNAHLVQVITTKEEITDIGLDGGYDVSVRDGVELNLADVMRVATSADSLEFVNTRLNGGRINEYVAPSDVALHGDIILSFDDMPTDAMLLFENTSGDGVVHVSANESDVLHIVQTYRVNTNVFVRLARSTDYARILDNDMGRFLNNLRNDGGDEKLFSKLDSVNSLSELDGVLSASVRTNPIKLMQPITNMYLHKSLEIMHIDDGVDGGVELFAIYSSDFLIDGVGAHIQFNIDKLHVKIFGNVSDINCSADVNEYDAVSFGGGINVRHDISKNDFVRANIGLDKTMFDVGLVFDGTGAINNPDGLSGYAIGEFMHKFDFDGGYNIAPFIFAGGEYMSVVNIDDKSAFAGAGSEFGFGYNFDGLRYDCALRAMARTDSAIGVGANISLWSVMDAAGGNVHLDAIYSDDFGMSYKLSINGVFRF